jgi:hypothetical protein
MESDLLDKRHALWISHSIGDMSRPEQITVCASAHTVRSTFMATKLGCRVLRSRQGSHSRIVTTQVVARDGIRTTGVATSADRPEREARANASCGG